ncbi:SDR family oxidoreductase [Leifsonia sp. NPDC058292]|uniref:SDR family oxidoreductase n=1 Tax=Leifsonia sp. NPDC058292 TaxID=3346428 RepID=UPI0036DE6D17
MTEKRPTVLVVGASGSIGRLVVEEALRRGLATRALIRDESKAAGIPDAAETVIGDLTRADTLQRAVAGIDGVVFTHGAHEGGSAAMEAVDYGAVKNVLAALGDRPARISLMTLIGITNRDGGWNRANEALDWKRRSERLVRASGRPYTIVRPGWFDRNESDEHRIVLLQGDRPRAEDASDGVIAREQIAEALVDGLTSDAADHKTFDLVAERGAAQTDRDALYAALDADPAGALDGVHDPQNMPLDAEPQRVLADLDAVRPA